MTETGALYGKSLYDLAASEMISDEIMKQLEMVQDLFRENEDYIRLLLEPSIAKKERLALLDQAFGEALHPYVLNFLKILTEKGILREFHSCVETYRSLYCKDQGIADAKVTSAAALEPEQLKLLREKLESMSGKRVLLRQRVDPSVLGGLLVEMDGRQYDGTVKGRLSDLRRKLTETVL